MEVEGGATAAVVVAIEEVGCGAQVEETGELGVEQVVGAAEGSRG